MSFQSLGFASFVTIVVAAYWLAPDRFRRHVLLLSSYAFYATWNLPNTALLAGVTILVHRLGLALESAKTEQAKARIVTWTLAGLVALLASFKYAIPLLAGAAGKTSSGTVDGPLTAFDLVAPLGISYYVFRLISYVLDVHWSRLPAERSLLDFASYVAFFPQILSGPIQRAGDFLRQGAGRRPLEMSQIQSGLRLILFGFFEKFVVADRLGIGIDAAFADTSTAGPGQLLVAIYLFPWQLYADFAGLTDIAIGVARLFNVKSPENFNAPFYAADIVDFWRRWHMTLTSWVTDYLFTPLHLRLRHWGRWGLGAAIFVNMLAIGLWHGARWTFVIFGVLNGAYVVAATMTMKKRNRFFSTRPRLMHLRRITGPLLTFHMVAFACILFRASSLGAARDAFIRALPAYWHPGQVLEGVRASWHGVSPLAFVLMALVVMELVHLARRRRWLGTLLYARPLWIRWTVYYSAFVSVVLCGLYSTKTFIYVQF